MFDYFSTLIKGLESRITYLESGYAPDDAFERWWESKGMLYHTCLDAKGAAKAAWLAKN